MTAAWVRDGLLQLGPTMIKLGQVFSSRKDLLHPAYCEALESLQTAVPCVSASRVRELLEACGRSADDLSTFVVIDSEGFFTRSTAALRVAKTLPKPALNAAAAAIVAVPAPLRDAAYLLVAKNRYRLLGRDEDGATPSCQLRAYANEVAVRFLP